jgi:phage gp36-like protein
MTYCTIDDIKAQLDERDLVQLTDDRDAGIVDAAVVDRAIADADAEINGYLGARYAVPLDPVPAVIGKYAVDMAVYHLESRRRGASEHRKERYDAALKFLTKVGEGKLTLGIDDPEATPRESEAPAMASTNPERVFSRDTMKGF